MEELKYIDIGGGLTVDYGFDPNEKEPRLETSLPDFAEYAKQLRIGVPYLFEKTDLLVFTEFGRSVSAKCGFVVSQVEYVKETGTNFYCSCLSFPSRQSLPLYLAFSLTLSLMLEPKPSS